VKASRLILRRDAFTLLDLLIVLFIIAILASLMFPALGRAKARARRIQCISNLKQTALAFRMFAADHEQRFPWLVSPADGGSADDIRQDAFFHFRVLSNELDTPKMLLCPSDHAKSSADAWENLADTNLSYFVGLEGDELRPQSMLAGDRNLNGTYNSTPCPALNSIWISLGLAGVPMGSSIDANSFWTKDLHHNAGNVMLSDGSAHQLSSRGLQQQTIESDPFNNNNHARMPH
jgi:type II secretory pathway pseudopilin PulG